MIAAPYSADAILLAFRTRDLSTSGHSKEQPSGFNFRPSGGAVPSARHADIVRLAARLAMQVHFEGLSQAAAIAALKTERASGRWTRDVPDQELEAALDSALEKCASGQWKPANDDVGAAPARAQLAEALSREIVPFTDDDFDRAKVPHPHVFGLAGAGYFPVGGVTVVAAPGREGKTYAMVYIAAACVLGRPLGKHRPTERLRVLCYSNEDDRIQYARKVLALSAGLSNSDASALRRGLLVPDLEVPDLIDARSIVGMSDKRRPVPTPMVDAIIESLVPKTTGPDRIGMIIFETGSTLSDADEDNPSLKSLVAALKRIARELKVAVVLVHHTSQAAAANLPSMNLSAADIRGGTALAFNSRQCFLLVNLGSADEPFHERDVRTLLRQFVAPFTPSRVSALICLDSSKAMDPPPLFLSWVDTEYGPAMVELQLADPVAGMRWRKLRTLAIAHGLEERQNAKEGKQNADIDECVAVVRSLHADGKHPTVRAVSRALGHGPDWAKSRLAAAKAQGILVRTLEHVPNTKGDTEVYRPSAATSMVESTDPSDCDE